MTEVFTPNLGDSYVKCTELTANHKTCNLIMKQQKLSHHLVSCHGYDYVPGQKEPIGPSQLKEAKNA